MFKTPFQLLNALLMLRILYIQAAIFVDLDIKLRAMMEREGLKHD